MGCVSSKKTGGHAGSLGVGEPGGGSQDTAAQDHHNSVVSYPATGPLNAKDYKDRLTSSEGTHSVMMPESGCVLKYAYVSQRGYYPDAPEKANQDSFAAIAGFNGDPEQHFFAVFDGHGEFGTECSLHAREQVPMHLANDSHFAVSPEIAFQHALVTANNTLHRSEVDDTMSGTTAISCLMRGRVLYVANVGDSRAVLATKQGDKLVAQELSQDQTPFRRDESERVGRCGARVLTLDQLEGLKDPNVESWGAEDEGEGDPPRLWAQDGMYPGTAFTRSIGDAVAERIGVIAEPEVAIRPLTPSSPFLIIASDGVFEFLPSQNVVDMVARFDDPHEACIAVVAESYRLWLQYETRTDDITMIVVQISGLEDETPAMALPTPLGPPVDYSALAFRKQNLHGGSRVTRCAAIENMEPLGVQPLLKVRKSEAELTRLDAAIRKNFFFSALSQVQWELLYSVMRREIVRAGQVVIHQGDQGDDFYVVDSGQFDVYVAGLGGGPGEALPMLVHTYSTLGGRHPSFGELSLMYGKPRAASVVARTDGVLWKLERRSFKAVLHHNQSKHLMQTFRSVEVFQGLTMGQVQAVVDLMEEVNVDPGERIVKQGDAGNDFYLITSGEVLCEVLRADAVPGEKPKKVLWLTKNQYFGERALLATSTRGATVTATQPTSLLRLSRGALEAALGPLEELTQLKSRWEERVRHQPDLVLQHTVSNPATLNLDQLQMRGTLYATECSVVALLEHLVTGDIVTVRLTSIAEATRRGREQLLLRNREITRGLQASLCVPAVPRTAVTNAVIAEQIMTNALCTMELLMHPTPFDEESAKFVTASVVLGLEQLHMTDIIYRSLSVETVIFSEDGNVQLVDFRFAKRFEGRTYSLCGNPEYLAPEIVHSIGHTLAVDWWSLGVFIYAILSNQTPFAAESDDELRIYRKITSRVFTYPHSFSPTACDLIDKLLQMDPTKRLGSGPTGADAIKAHPWFRGLDWEALGANQLKSPAGIREKIYNFEGLEVVDIDRTPMQHRDVTWADGF